MARVTQEDIIHINDVYYIFKKCNYTPTFEEATNLIINDSNLTRIIKELILRIGDLSHRHEEISF